MKLKKIPGEYVTCKANEWQLERAKTKMLTRQIERKRTFWKNSPTQPLPNDAEIGIIISPLQ